MKQLCLSSKLALLAAAFGGLALQQANAGVITSAASATGPAPFAGYSIDRTIDQSGLSINYVSGVTDFSTYISAGPLHTRSNSPLENYLASLTGPPAPLDFDMGSSMLLSRLAMWNYPFNDSAGIRNFQVYTSNVSNFATSTLVGTFTAADDGDGLINNAQVFDFLDSTARYLRVAVQTTWDGNNIGMSEIAFDVVAAASVPEPGVLALLGLGLVGFGIRRRRKS